MEKKLVHGSNLVSQHTLSSSLELSTLSMFFTECEISPEENKVTKRKKIDSTLDLHTKLQKKQKERRNQGQIKHKDITDKGHLLNMY